MLWRLVQQSNSERELILKQRQTLSSNARAIGDLRKDIKRMLSALNQDSQETVEEALGQILDKFDDLDTSVDE
jgi:phage host-nuclease inhibitor protein Gam